MTILDSKLGFKCKQTSLYFSSALLCISMPPPAIVHFQKRIRPLVWRSIVFPNAELFNMSTTSMNSAISRKRFFSCKELRTRSKTGVLTVSLSISLSLLHATSGTINVQEILEIILDFNFNSRTLYSQISSIHVVHVASSSTLCSTWSYE